MKPLTKDQVNGSVEDQSTTILKHGSHLKNPTKFSRDYIGEKVFSECTHPITKEFLVSDDDYQLILNRVIARVDKAKRLSDNTQGEGYNIWMKDLKWFLDRKNENGFGARCFRKCKALQELLGWTDAQLSQVARCFDKVTEKDGNHAYRGVDSNDTYRDNTSNLGKITEGLGDNKKDVKRGELGEISK